MATNQELVQQMYVAYFNRPGDAAGVEFYTGVLDGGASIEAIRADFAKSAEYTSAYAGKSAEAIVDQIYLNIFGHHADVPGLKFYANLLTNRTLTIDKIVTDIAAGAQGSDKVAFDSKVAAAVAFTTAISNNAEQRVAYAEHSATALAAARSYLAGVTDATTLAAATANIDQAAASVIPTIVHNLTQGLDTRVGNSGNDVFNAFAFNSVSGADATTLSSVDTIDGGVGTDVLNIEVKDTGGGTDFNNSIVGNIKNVEVVNINNVAALSAGAVDASVLGAALQQVWQEGKEAAVTNLSATATAGFRNIAAAQTFDVGAAAAAATAMAAFDGVAEASTVNFTGTKLAGVVLSGTVDDTNADDAVDATNVSITSTAKVVTVNSTVDAVVTVTDASLVTLDASASVAGIEYISADTDVNTIKTGAGDDNVKVVAATLAAAGSTPATDAAVSTGAGDDMIEVAVSGTGTTTVTAGDGADTVDVTARGTGKLAIDMGAGNDSFTASGVAVAAGDTINAGAGTDTLLLNLVGSSNIGAFAGFDVFDAKALGQALDVDILSSKNTVTEFITTGDVGATASLVNIGAGVGFRVTGDTNIANAITLTQKTADAITVTLDIDETGTTAATTASTARDAAVVTNATALNVVFSSDFVKAATGAGDNVDNLNITAAAAKTVTVASGGANVAANVLDLSAAVATTLTVTGAANLTLGTIAAAALATIDASAATGGLTASLANVKDGGTIKLGTGVDTITVTNASTPAGVESIVSFEKAAAASIGSDATAAAAAIADADHLVIGTGAVADASTVAGGAVNTKGVLSFTGAGPATLAAAVAIADLGAETNGEAVVFQYLSDSYVFVQGATDTLVKLTGVTGVTNLVETGTDHFFLV